MPSAPPQSALVMTGEVAVVAVAALAAAVKCVFNRRRRRKRLQEAQEGKVDDPPLTSLPLRRSASRTRNATELELEEGRAGYALGKATSASLSTTPSQATLDTPRPLFHHSFHKHSSPSLSSSYSSQPLLNYGERDSTAAESRSSYASADTLPIPAPAHLRSRSHSHSHLRPSSAGTSTAAMPPTPTAAPEPEPPRATPPGRQYAPPPGLQYGRRHSPAQLSVDEADPLSRSTSASSTLPPSYHTRHSNLSSTYPLPPPQPPSRTVSAAAAAPSAPPSSAPAKGGEDTANAHPHRTTSPAPPYTSAGRARARMHRRSLSLGAATMSSTHTWRPSPPSAYLREVRAHRAGAQVAGPASGVVDPDSALLAYAHAHARGRSVDGGRRAHVRRTSSGSGSRSHRRLVKRKRSVDGGVRVMGGPLGAVGAGYREDGEPTSCFED